MKLYNGDCLEVMKELPDNSIDLIVTSPPYEDISGAGYKADKKDILFLKLYSQFIDEVFEQYQRILKNGGQLFFNIKSKTANKKLRTPHWLEFTNAFQQLDFKSYIIWKYAGSFDSTNSRFHLDYEIIYHLSKGDNIYLNTDCGIDDPLTSVWYVPHNIPKAERVHPTQMPLALADRILKIAAKPNDVVLDNFMGSGTTGIACIDNNLEFIGIELNDINYNIAKERIDEKLYNNTN